MINLEAKKPVPEAARRDDAARDAAADAR